MNVKKWLDKVAYIDKAKLQGDEDGKCYYSKFDGSYITRVGMEDTVKLLAELEITEELTHGVGFSPKDNKWYGWSHRAIYGFEVGSTCKKGDLHYRASNLEDEIEDAIYFWSDDTHLNVKATPIDDGVIQVTWKYSENIPNKKMRGEEGGAEWRYDPNNFGKGEWTAETMADAKQMAIDFNEGVS